MRRLATISACALFAALPALAQEIRFPGEAALNNKRIAASDSLFLPVAGFADGVLDGIIAEGQIEQSAWRVGAGNLTTLEMLAPLRDAFLAAGFEGVYSCQAAACG